MPRGCGRATIMHKLIFITQLTLKIRLLYLNYFVPLHSEKTSHNFINQK